MLTHLPFQIGGYTREFHYDNWYPHERLNGYTHTWEYGGSKAIPCSFGSTLEIEITAKLLVIYLVVILLFYWPEFISMVKLHVVKFANRIIERKALEKLQEKVGDSVITSDGKYAITDEQKARLDNDKISYFLIKQN